MLSDSEGLAKTCFVSESWGETLVWEKTAALASWKKLIPSSVLDYHLKFCLQYCTACDIVAKLKTKICKREIFS